MCFNDTRLITHTALECITCYLERQIFPIPDISMLILSDSLIRTSVRVVMFRIMYYRRRGER